MNFAPKKNTIIWATCTWAALNWIKLFQKICPVVKTLICMCPRKTCTYLLKPCGARCDISKRSCNLALWKIVLYKFCMGGLVLLALQKKKKQTWMAWALREQVMSQSTFFKLPVAARGVGCPRPSTPKLASSPVRQQQTFDTSSSIGQRCSLDSLTTLALIMQWLGFWVRRNDMKT
jgi:hypothetical protein